MVRPKRKTTDKGADQVREQWAERREQRELDNLKEEVVSLKQQIQQASSTSKQASTAGEGQTQAIKALTSELEKKERQYGRTLDDLREATRARDQLRQDITALESSIQSDDRVKEQARQLKDAVAKCSALEAQLVALEEESAVYRQRVEQLEHGAAPAVSIKERAQQKERVEPIQKLQSKLEGMKTERRSLQERVHGSKIKIDKLETERARLTRLGDELKQKLSASSSTHGTAGAAQAPLVLEKVPFAVVQQLTQVRDQAEKLETEKSSLTAQITHETRQIQQYEKEVKQLRAKISHVKQSSNPSAAKAQAGKSATGTPSVLSTLTSTLHLSDFDVSKLAFMGNSILSTVLQGCSAIDVLVSLSERVHAADSDVAQLTLVLDSAQEALANSEKALQERQQRPAETPPASPAAARKELIGLDQEKAAALGVEVVEAQYEVEQQQERAAELEGRLAAFEAASEQRAASRTNSMSRKSDTRVTTRSSSSRIVATLAKQISDLNKQLSELRDENMELLLKLSGVSF